jgi:protein-L-isoaspartate(D-aspartate) O-methyltransferase
MDLFESEREQMVRFQIANKGVSDERVLAAMLKVPRHCFVPLEAQNYAYIDSPLRIGSGQTISQPYIVALMTELLDVQPEQRVLDVGTGSGYQAAILGELAAEVFSIERHPELAETARTTLEGLGYQNIQVHVGDGTQGFAPAAPYDRIIVAAAAPVVPQALLDQLAVGGRLVIPVGPRYSQRLEVWDRQGEQYKKTTNIPVVFVPLIGEGGWED